jgi:hypothetical protein
MSSIQRKAFTSWSGLGALDRPSLRRWHLGGPGAQEGGRCVKAGYKTGSSPNRKNIDYEFECQYPLRQV